MNRIYICIRLFADLANLYCIEYFTANLDTISLGDPPTSIIFSDFSTWAVAISYEKLKVENYCFHTIIGHFFAVETICEISGRQDSCVATLCDFSCVS